MIEKLYLIILPFIIVLMLFSCEKHPLGQEAEIEEIYYRAKKNYDTSRDSLVFYYQKYDNYDTLKLSKLSKARINYVHGLMLETKLKYDSASVCFLYGASLLPNNAMRSSMLLRAACDKARVLKHSDFKSIISEVEVLLKKIKSPEQDAAYWGAKGDFCVEIEDYNMAIKCYTSADSILKENGIVKTRDYYHNRLGYVFRRLYKYPPAFEHTIKSIELSTMNRNKYRLVSSYLELSRMYRDAQQYEEAFEWGEKHLALAKELNDGNHIRRGLELMGILYAQTKKWDLAETYFKQSLDLARDLNHHYEIGDALSNFGNFYMLKGDTVLALYYYEESYDYRKKHNNKPKQMLTSLYHLGDAYGTRNVSFSEFYLKKAASIADSTKEIGWAISINKRLADLYESIQDYKNCNYALQRYIEAKKQWDHKAQNSKFNKLTMQFETQEKEYLIDLQRNKLNARNNLLIAIGLAFLFIVIAVVIVLKNNKIRAQAIKRVYKQQLLVQDQQKVIDELLKKTERTKPDTGHNKMIRDLLYLLDVKQIFRQADLSLDSLSKELGSNTTYVSQLINKEFKCNFKTLINNYRINYCKEQIEHSKEGVFMKNIGLNAGFKSQSTFYASFKNVVGITPLQFAKISKMKHKD